MRSRVFQVGVGTRLPDVGLEPMGHRISNAAPAFAIGRRVRRYCTVSGKSYASFSINSRLYIGEADIWIVAHDIIPLQRLLWRKDVPACRRIEKHEIISAVYECHANVFATACSCGKLWQVLASFQIIAMIRFGCVTIYRNYRSFAIGSIFTSMCCVVGNTDFSKEGPLCGASRDCRYVAIGGRLESEYPPAQRRSWEHSSQRNRKRAIRPEIQRADGERCRPPHVGGIGGCPALSNVSPRFLSEHVIFQ